MAENQQFQETNTPDIAYTRQAIFQVRKDIAAEKENERKLSGQLMEKKNWLAGHPFDDETLKSRGLLHTARDKKAETESLVLQLAESKQRFKKLELNLQQLEAIEFSADQAMALAVADYRESSVCVEELRGQDALLSRERKQAVEALNKAHSLLNQAQAAKRKSLSLSDVSKASEEESSAKRQVEELEALVKNLDEALSPLPAKLSAKQTELKSVETRVWNAKLGQLLTSIQQNPEFALVFELIEMAFAAWVKAGKTHSVEHFLKEAFVGGNLLRVDHDFVSARQSEMAKAIGLAS